MENSTGNHATARLILDYIRTFIWPVTIVLAMIFYKNDILNMLKTRQFKVAGVFEVGEKINDLNTNAQTELTDLKKFIDEINANINNPSKIKQIATDLSTNVESIKTNLTKDLSQIKRESSAPQLNQSFEPLATGDTKSQAKEMETLGFKLILDKDIDSAIDAFTKSEALWPDYHNVAEIKRLLIKKRDELTNTPKDERTSQWDALNRLLLSKYSWGMPLDVRTKLYDSLK